MAVKGAIEASHAEVDVLGGYTFHQALSRQFKKQFSLFPADRMGAFQKIPDRISMLQVIQQHPYRHTSTRKARRSAHAIGIDPYHLIDLDPLFRGHNSTLEHRRPGGLPVSHAPHALGWADTAVSRTTRACTA